MCSPRLYHVYPTCAFWPFSGSSPFYRGLTAVLLCITIYISTAVWWISYYCTVGRLYNTHSHTKDSVYSIDNTCCMQFADIFFIGLTTFVSYLMYCNALNCIVLYCVKCCMVLYCTIDISSFWQPEQRFVKNRRAVCLWYQMGPGTNIYLEV